MDDIPNSLSCGIGNKLNSTIRSSIRKSKHDDLEAIRLWLVEEDSQGIPGNFLCNWSVIERAHRNGNLLVYIDGRTGIPVAFQVGGLIQPGILQVRNAYRRTGIGKKMVERCITLATKQDKTLLFIECKPSTSIPFWMHMGFTLIESASGKNYAYRTIEKMHQLPGQGVDVEVVIRFYPESKKWEPETEPYAAYSPQARMSQDSTIYLAQRIQFHEKAFPNVQDVVIEIEVDGNYRFCDKAKYDRARRIGVMSCTNGFYVDVVHIQKKS